MHFARLARLHLLPALAVAVVLLSAARVEAGGPPPPPPPKPSPSPTATPPTKFTMKYQMFWSRSTHIFTFHLVVNAHGQRVPHLVLQVTQLDGWSVVRQGDSAVPVGDCTGTSLPSPLLQTHSIRAWDLGYAPHLTKCFAEISLRQRPGMPHPLTVTVYSNLAPGNRLDARYEVGSIQWSGAYLVTS